MDIRDYLLKRAFSQPVLTGYAGLKGGLVGGGEAAWYTRKSHLESKERLKKVLQSAAIGTVLGAGVGYAGQRLVGAAGKTFGDAVGHAATGEHLGELAGASVGSTMGGTMGSKLLSAKKKPEKKNER